jgi:hypothetical protein
MGFGKNVAITRILGQYGYVASNGYALTSGNTVLGYIRSNMSLSVSASSSISSFTLSITGSATPVSFKGLSLVQTDTSNYIGNIISSVSNNPSISANNYTLQNGSVTGQLYVEKLYQYYINTLSSSATLGLVSVPSASSYMTSYANSTSTTIVSKPVNGHVFDLFQVNTISDGKESVKVKIGIEAINDTTGQFNLFIRDLNDTDKNPVVLENWTRLSMDPTSERYIGQIIGNSYIQINTDGSNTELGEFPTNSKFIYLTNINTALPTASITIVPGGFKGYIGNAIGGLSEPTLPLKRNQLNSNSAVDKKVYMGVDFSQSNLTDFFSAKPVSLSTGSQTAYKGFLLFENVENTSLSSQYYGINGSNYGSSSYGVSVYNSSSSSTYYALDNFLLPVVGGFDGFDEEALTENKLKFNIAYSNSALTTTNTVVSSIGYSDFKLSIDSISDDDNVDYKALFTFDIINQDAIQYALTMVETRGDVIYIPDMVSATGDENDLISYVGDYDTSYAAVYYPGYKEKDTNTGKYNWLNASYGASEAFSYTDTVAYPWYAPAGITRGKLDTAYIAYKKVNAPLRTLLAQNNINPIVTFNAKGANGLFLLGNSTLQVASSALSDVNVRRLLIEARKFVASVGLKLLYEPGDQDLFDTFTNTCNPYFNRVKALRGLIQYKVIMNSTTTSNDDLDKDQINGFIAIQPTKAIEVINIGFIITKQGAIFDNII